MAVYECCHIRVGGFKCRGLALKGREFCYFHARSRDERKARAANPAVAAIDLPLIEDRESLQLAVGRVLAGVGSGACDARRAGILLYGLQIASNHLPRQVHYSAFDAELNPQTDASSGEELATRYLADKDYQRMLPRSNT